jgi:hypothetical protein
VSAIEDRLRDAYHEAAETVRPDSIPGPPGLDPAPARPARATTPARLARPLAAAAAVAAIAVAATLAVPRIWPGRQAAPVGWNAPPPRYYAEVATVPHSSKTVLNIIDAATGRRTGQLGSPRHGIYFREVASLGGDRSFVAAAAVPLELRAIEHNCNTWLYRFRINGAGRPTAPRPLSVAEVRGYTGFMDLAGSADGSTVAYTTDLGACRPNKPLRYPGEVNVLHLASGRVTSWPFRLPASPTSLTLSAGGRLLGFVSNRSDGAHSGGPASNYSWVLRTDSPPGPLQRYYHRVTGHSTVRGIPVWPSVVVLSPSARTMLTAIVDPGGNTKIMALRDYQPRTGRLTRAVRILRAHGDYWTSPGLSPSNSGRYLLLYFWNSQVARLDLATGRLTVLPRIPIPQSAAW